MTIISLIAAVDEHGGIGKDNKLLCHLPADLSHFKALTIGKPVIMGRKTYESLGKALPGRLNVVLSTQLVLMDDAVRVGSLTDALEMTKNAPEVMIIGGAQVFHEALLLAHRIYLTLIHAELDADSFFPTLDKQTWQLKESTDRRTDEKNKYNMTFCRYERES